MPTKTPVPNPCGTEAAIQSTERVILWLLISLVLTLLGVIAAIAWMAIY